MPHPEDQLAVRPGAAAGARQPVRSKPLLRGWLHAAAAVGAVILTAALCWRSWGDVPRLVALLIFGLSLIELYAVSAVYHIGSWSAVVHRRLRALDHANIFVVIAGTYTPFCAIMLSGWLRLAILSAVWVVAAIGAGCAPLMTRVPRSVAVALYLSMGWIALPTLPTFFSILPWTAVALVFVGGLLYSVGALIYVQRRPNFFPHIFGFHEIFHLLVIAGGAAFAAVIWIWALPFPGA